MKIEILTTNKKNNFMQTATNLQIIPFSTVALEWHLLNNAGLKDHAVARIVDICNKVNSGEMLLNDYLPEPACTVADMLDDLRIDYNDDSSLL